MALREVWFSQCAQHFPHFDGDVLLHHPLRFLSPKP